MGRILNNVGYEEGLHIKRIGCQGKAESELFYTPRKHHSHNSRNKRNGSKSEEDHAGEIGAEVG